MSNIHPMSTAHLGNPLTDSLAILGGRTRIYQSGMTIKVEQEEVLISFAFPIIERPSIVMGNPATTPLFPSTALHFRLNHWEPRQFKPHLDEALNGRLTLVTTAHPTVEIPVLVGNINLITPGHNIHLGRLLQPAVYGASLTAPDLQERQLYDVAVRDDNGRLHIIAPQAVYHRKTWANFGIAHITDIHVARRIDSFHGILREAGRTEGVQYLYNWNDRFRGFIKYANYLHNIGVLDLILATSDLYDYLDEDDDDPTGGGNAAFVRQLILGRAPGPDFSEVEGLLVPIFTVPGNHDYRKHRYKPIFEIHFVKDFKRVENFSGYYLLEALFENSKSEKKGIQEFQEKTYHFFMIGVIFNTCCLGIAPRIGSLNNFMTDETDPQQLSLPELAGRCEQETKHYFRGEEPDTRYCFELFRRAIQDGEDAAWDNIYPCYKALVASWVTQHPGFESTGESVEYFVNGAFAKLSTTLTKERFHGFSDLRSILRYFKMCVSSLIVDYIRLARMPNPYSLEDVAEEVSTEVPPEAQVMDRAVRQEFWEKINQRLHDDLERAVIQGLFVFGLKPRELYEQMPTLFASVDEIYRITQNVFARLRRDPDIPKFLG